MDLNRLTDPLNRGMVGGLLGIPAEIAAMVTNGGRSIGNLANRLAGVNAPPAPMIENPQFGQEWWGNKMQQAGYVTPNRNALAEFGAGLLDPGSAMTHGPALAKGLFGLSDPATLKSIGGLLGATVWHGSPHKFDKFDASKIGTGEGAQAYGHGLYFAESPDVAQSYAQSVKANTGELVKRGAAHGLPEDVASNLAAALQSGKSFDPVLDAARKMIDNPLVPAPQRQAAQRLLDHEMPAYNAWSEWSKPGQVYKVDLPDDAIAKMLDWDKPLSQQAPEVLSMLQKSRNKTVKDALAKMNEPGAYSGELMDGAGLIRLLSMNTSGRQISPQASQAIQKAGIPGIRYLDGGSRGTGAGTSNFVVFPGNEGLLKILERNGQPLK